ncbi:MAG: universal stress protein, partial [Alphaproteobacteria bacterium]|nr:universal stress protein [Alphaproteobacteria bacterium]
MTRFNVALGIAKAHQAHLIALYNASPVSMPQTGRGASREYLAEATEIAYEKALTVRAEIEEVSAKANVPVEWRIGEGDHIKVLSQHALAVDLVIVSHAKADELEDRITFHIPENTVLYSGCPVLVIPQKYKVLIPGTHIMIAWKGCSESLLAARDAMPLLKIAEKVTLFTVVKPSQESIEEQEFANFLSRHDVLVNVARDESSAGNVGESILKNAKDFEADLIV